MIILGSLESAIVDFLLALIELFSLGVTAEALRAIIGSKSAKKSSINTNRKSTTRFPMSPRWTSYVVPKTPKGGSKTQCPKFEQ